MRAQVKKWGNSASVRIPSAVMTAAALRIDQPVDIHAVDGRIVIEPVSSQGMTLEERIAALDPDTFHELVDFGPPAGDEFW